MKTKVVVWPAYSVVGIEIAEQIRFMKNVELYGAADQPDNPMSYLYKDVFEVPNVGNTETKNQFIFDDFIIFPAHDFVLDWIATNPRIKNYIGSSPESIRLTRNKVELYKKVRTTELAWLVPKYWEEFDESLLKNGPIYAKPVSGYGSQNHFIINSPEDMRFQETKALYFYSELLTGDEITVECISDEKSELIYANPRARKRIRMGTSMSFQFVEETTRSKIEEISRQLSSDLKIVGPWYFQLKFKDSGQAIDEIRILEISTRLPGSAVWSRANGVNIAEISMFLKLGTERIRILEQKVKGELERGLSSHLKLQSFKILYIDLDATILIDGILNPLAISFIVDCRNKKIKVILITKSLSEDLTGDLISLGIIGLFDEIVHVPETNSKSQYMTEKNSIFIDDSFSEREDVLMNLQIPSYGPEILSLVAPK